MKIIIAEHAGFCFGVEMALKKTYESLEKNSISTLGPLIHNKFVTLDLAEKGVDIIEDIEDFKKEKLVIRSHGVGKDVYTKALEKNIELIDSTCVYVKKIHKMVLDAYLNDRKIIIIGDKNHPEVIGINGWAENSCIIFNNKEEICKYKFEDMKYFLVCQTTFNHNSFEEILEILKTKDLDIEIKNTICKATANRQISAIHLSKEVDVMIVIGDKNSSNTNKLYELCKENCKNTYLIESIHDLELKTYQSSDIIGITAGASTPLHIIKEAKNTMSDKSFEELLNESYVPPLHNGDVVTGKVLGISNGEVSVSLQYNKADGIIPRDEFSDNPNELPENILRVDDEIEVFVIKSNDGEGNVLLSKKRLDTQKSILVLEEYYNNGTIVKGRIIDLVKGGAIALIDNTRVFVPASQISNRFVRDLTEFKDKEFDFKIIEFDKTKRRIIASRKELAEQEAATVKNEVFGKLAVGEKITGVVSRISDFGAFVDLGGVDGLIHISEISWGRVNKVSDILKVGDKISPVVLALDVEKGKISLSLKTSDTNPWAIAASKYAIGNVVEGKVVRMVAFGAFIELEPGIDGLVHISQISEKHIAKAEDELTIGETIKVQVTDFDGDSKKISLSIKALDAPVDEATITEATSAPEADEEITE